MRRMLAKIGRTTIDEKSKKLLEGQGRYILSANHAEQEACALTVELKQEYKLSIFTYYLLQALKGNTESIDSEGNVTPRSLGRYVYREIMNLPYDKRPRQAPITRAEESGDIILASYPELPKKIEDTLASMLKLLREGNVQDFNKMREENSPILPMPDFSMENIDGAHIAGANLSNANLKNIKLPRANLEGANFSNSNLFKANLEGANLEGANFSNSNLFKANLEGANLSKTNCTNAVLEEADLSRANLSKADLSRANLSKADLSRAKLSFTMKASSRYWLLLVIFLFYMPFVVLYHYNPQLPKDIDFYLDLLFSVSIWSLRISTCWVWINNFLHTHTEDKKKSYSNQFR